MICAVASSPVLVLLEEAGSDQLNTGVSGSAGLSWDKPWEQRTPDLVICLVLNRR